MYVNVFGIRCFKALHLSVVRPNSARPRSAFGSASDSTARDPGFDTRFRQILSFLLPLIQEGQLSVTGESMCTKYWLTALEVGKVSLPGLSCHDVTDRVFPYDLGFTVYLRRCYRRYGGKCR